MSRSRSTRFEAGSVSKPFTTAAMVLLVRAGKLSLDDPVRKYVPELPDFSVPLTIRPCCGTPVECQLLGTRSSATNPDRQSVIVARR